MAALNCGCAQKGCASPQQAAQVVLAAGLKCLRVEDERPVRFPQRPQLSVPLVERGVRHRLHTNADLIARI